MSDQETKRPSEGLTRRQTMGLIVGGAAAVAAGGSIAAGEGARAEPSAPVKRSGASAKLPALFLAHGAPPLLDMPDWMAQLSAWAKALPRPEAILMLSAHWEERPFTYGATRTVPLVYDFYGFPQRYYQTRYPAPGAPALARRLEALVGQHQPVAHEPARGLDHGAYVPLVAMYPEADIPVLQASLPSQEPRALHELGRQLAPLREEGVLIIGSGFITHNLRQISWDPNARPPQWAADFDGWTAETLRARDVDALLDYRAKGPGVRMSLPTHEHFVPLIVAQAAALDEASVRFPIEGFAFGSATKRSVQFG